MTRVLTVCTALVAVAALAACDSPADTTAPAPSDGTSSSSGQTSSPADPETSLPGTATRQELLVASVEIPDGVPFADTTESFRQDSVDRTWLLGTEDEYRCAVVLSIWFSTTGWTFRPEEGYTGDGIEPGVTVQSQGPDPSPLPGTTHPFQAVESGPSGTVTPAFLGDTTHVHRTYATPDELTRVDLDVTALDEEAACDPAAIAATLQWDGEQLDQASFDAARSAVSTP